MQIVKVNFAAPVAKVSPNQGTIIAVNDVVRLITKSDGPDTDTTDVTVKLVENGGRTIGWDREVVDLRPQDVLRVHSRHKYTPA